jgi:DNA mismatch repair ATPase MutS
MNGKTKIMVGALTGSTLGAAILARSVLGLAQNSATPLEVTPPEVTVEKVISGVSSEVKPSEKEMKHFKDQLESNLVGLQESLQQLEEQRTIVVKKDLARREQYVQVDHLLACFKDAYIQGKSHGFPRMVFTQCYSQKQIEELVQSLLNRREELKNQESKSLKQIDQAIAQLNVRIAETKRHIDNIPVYVALAEAGSHAGKSDLVRNALVVCLDSNHKYLETQPSRYLPEDTKMAGIPASQIPSATQFLARSYPVLPQICEGQVPTVSDLTNALREIVNNRP